MTSMLKHISALVTGGASGLGRATVERLAKGGARVAIFDLPSSAGGKVASKINKNVLFIPGDVTSEKDVEDALSIIEQKFKSLNTVVNCAGISEAQRTLNLNTGEPHSLEDFKRVIRVNTLGPFNVARLSTRLIILNEEDDDGGRGVIVNTASIAAYEGAVGQAAYAASAGALASMTTPMARDLGPKGIRVVTIAPGLFDTPLAKAMPEPFKDLMAASTPFPARLGKPEEFAHLVEHVILNRMLNGCVIRLDGALRFHT